MPGPICIACGRGRGLHAPGCRLASAQSRHPAGKLPRRGQVVRLKDDTLGIYLGQFRDGLAAVSLHASPTMSTAIPNDEFRVATP